MCAQMRLQAVDAGEERGDFGRHAGRGDGGGIVLAIRSDAREIDLQRARDLADFPAREHSHVVGILPHDGEAFAFEPIDDLLVVGGGGLVFRRHLRLGNALAVADAGLQGGEVAHL